jgi:hypothetical protein
MLRTAPMQAIFALMVLCSTPLHGQVTDAAAKINDLLASFGNVTYIGRPQADGSCALTGMVEQGPRSITSIVGILPNGYIIGDNAEIISSFPLAVQQATFRNCTNSSSTVPVTLTGSITQTLQLTLTNVFTQSISGQLTIGTGNTPYGSYALQISGSRQWQTTTQTQQTTQTTVTVTDSMTSTLGSKKEFDVTLLAVQQHIKIPVTAPGIFDGPLLPCASPSPPGNMASSLLSDSQRTFVAKGYIEFDHATRVELSSSSERTADCDAQDQSLRLIPLNAPGSGH